ncbi:MAG: hypothetical protein L0K56_10470, partial [Corynebacterium sp.]|nr:hypothetical protein [Corynebacterium sp.]
MGEFTGFRRTEFLVEAVGDHAPVLQEFGADQTHRRIRGTTGPIRVCIEDPVLRGRVCRLSVLAEVRTGRRSLVGVRVEHETVATNIIGGGGVISAGDDRPHVPGDRAL